MRFEKIITAGISWLVLSAAASSCCRAGTDTWTAFVMGVPDTVDFKRSIETGTFYILKQTHEPLFRKDDGENYSSRLLKKWERSVSSDRYLFCPDDSYKFDDGTPFGLEYFEGYIRRVTSGYADRFQSERAGACILIKFQGSRKGYLDFLTKYENSPTIKNKAGAETGLGPFRIKNFKDGQAVLERKVRTSNGYNEIVLREFKSPDDAAFKSVKASDYNHIPIAAMPAWLKDEYQGFDTVELQTNNLIINSPEKKVRSFVYNCFDIDKFRRAFFPDKRDTYDAATVLPLGVPGARFGRPEQACSPLGHGVKRSIILLDHIANNRETLRVFSEELRRKTGVELKVIGCTPAELVAALHKKPRGYDLIVVAVDAVQPEYSLFFEYFVKEDGFLDIELPHLKSLYGDLVLEKDESVRSRIASDMADELAKEFVDLPLSQNVRRLYYPRGIKNLEIGTGFLEYPEVADFRW